MTFSSLYSATVHVLFPSIPAAYMPSENRCNVISVCNIDYVLKCLPFWCSMCVQISFANKTIAWIGLNALNFAWRQYAHRSIVLAGNDGKRGGCLSCCKVAVSTMLEVNLFSYLRGCLILASRGCEIAFHRLSKKDCTKQGDEFEVILEY